MLDFDQIFTLMASFGLSLSAGVRAYLPLLALGIASDVGPIGSFHIKLRSDFAWIGNPLFLALLAILTVYEISADKIPVVDHINDIVHTVIRPLSGALIFTATSNPLSNSGMTGAIIAALIGGGIAGTAHVTKAAVVRPATTVTTAGLGNPFVSLLEDVLVVITTALALIFPLIGFILIVFVLFFIIRAIVMLNRRRQQRAATNAMVTPGGGGTRY